MLVGGGDFGCDYTSATNRVTGCAALAVNSDYGLLAYACYMMGGRLSFA